MPRAGPNSAGSDRNCTIVWCRTRSKEDMALLPMLDDKMDAEKETQLYQEYVENA